MKQVYHTKVGTYLIYFNGVDYRFNTLVSTPQGYISWQPLNAGVTVKLTKGSPPQPIHINAVSIEDIKKIIEEITTTLSHQTKSKVSLEDILKNNSSLPDEMLSDFKCIGNVLSMSISYAQNSQYN